MSRLIVKNLPNKVPEQKLRELFGQYGTVTDIQFKYTPKGKFRQFCFIGYQNESEAEAAVKSLHSSFLNTNRITVEYCAALGDEKKPKSWSKYAPDSTAFKKTNMKETDVGTTVNNKSQEKKRKRKLMEDGTAVENEVNDKSEERKRKKIKKQDETIVLLEKYKNDPQFEEFLQVHAPKEAEKLHNLNKEVVNSKYSVSESADDSDNKSEQVEIEQETHKVANEEISDLEYIKKFTKKIADSEEKPHKKTEKKVKEKVNLFTVKLKGLPYNVKKKDIKDFFRTVTPYSIRIPRNVHGFAYVGFKKEKQFKKALLKDKSFIHGKRVSVQKFDTKNQEGEKDHPEAPVKRKWKSQEEALKDEESVAETGKIFFRNLAYTTTEEELKELFSKYGPLADITVPVDSSTEQIKGFGIVTFLMPEHAAKAYAELDGSILHGRLLHLLPGKSKETATLPENASFKQKKLEKQKAMANNPYNWNSLFLGHDAVANVMADTYGIKKEDIFLSEGKTSAAVRLALGETEIVAQTRKYLEQEGVVLDAFKDRDAPRSKTILLVKNLPSKTERQEIVDLFKQHVEVGRVILPPSGITAVVEFLNPTDAKFAFVKLMYSKFKNTRLFFEWAPENSLIDGKNRRTDTETEKAIDNDDGDVDKGQNEENEQDDEEPEPDTTIFVKNLNFITTDEALRKHFEGCGKICYANVSRRKDLQNAGKTLSMGYGFVRFIHKASADKALKTLQQSVLDGKSLDLKRSDRTSKTDVINSRKSVKSVKQNGSKILVRNIPFEANRKDILDIFKPFGEIKALRLPKKMGEGPNSHRGFAFVDYSTPSDAKAAFNALAQSTHVYGRRLVLEWASAEESVEELQKKQAEHFHQTTQERNKKSVFNID